MVVSDLPELLLIRGLPGSGKSTLAKRCAGYTHLETDQFFSRSGIYKFERALLRDAHNWCLAETRLKLSEGQNVVVSNPFTTAKELARFLALPANVRVFEATGEYRNVHGLPAAKVQKMRDKWEPYEFAEPLDTLPIAEQASAVARTNSDEDDDRAIFDLVLSGHPEGSIVDYVSSIGHADPVAVIIRATNRFLAQAQRTPILAQCGFLLDTYRALAKKSTEIGDYNGAKGILKEYFAGVKYIEAEGLADGEEEPAKGGGNGKDK